MKIHDPQFLPLPTGSDLIFRDLLEVQEASNSATIDFTGLSDIYNRFEIELINVVPATNDTELGLQISSDNGTSYDAGTSDYSWNMQARLSGSSPNGINDTTDDKILMTSTTARLGISNISSTGGVSGKIVLYRPYYAIAQSQFSWRMGYTDNSYFFYVANIEGAGITNAIGAYNAVRILMESGNITSGTFSLYGVR